eukprot:scaffold43088_cov64-Phaeocystis_antarctica.AAC.1
MAAVASHAPPSRGNGPGSSAAGWYPTGWPAVGWYPTGWPAVPLSIGPRWNGATGGGAPAGYGCCGSDGM